MGFKRGNQLGNTFGALSSGGKKGRSGRLPGPKKMLLFASVYAESRDVRKACAAIGITGEFALAKGERLLSEVGVKKLIRKFRIASEKRNNVAIRPLPLEITPMREYVKLYRDAHHHAVETNASDESAFVRLAAQALAQQVIEAAAVDHEEVAHELGEYLPKVMDICARLRGYKAPDVDEQRVLTAGRIAPSSDSLIAASGPGVDHLGRAVPVVDERELDSVTA